MMAPIAAIPEMTVGEQVTGVVIGAVTVILALVLLRSGRRPEGGSRDRFGPLTGLEGPLEQPEPIPAPLRTVDAAAAPALAAPRRWRLPTTLLMLTVGVLTAVGVFISPRQQPRVFVYYWASVFLMVAALVPLALYDWLVTRRRAVEDRRRVLAEQRQQLRDELSRYLATRRGADRGPARGAAEGPFSEDF